MKNIFQKICISVLALFACGSACAGKLSYSDVGSGRPIILIHPFPTDQSLWQPQRDGLKSHFRVITIDLQGFGKAKPVDGNAVTMTKYAEQVRELMDELHLENAIIGGESMGGYVALTLLSKYPQRVSGLILSNTQSIPDSEAAKARREAIAADVLANGTTAVINDIMAKVLTPSASDETRAYLKAILDAQSSFAMASALRGMALRPDLSQVLVDHPALPVLIITGVDDVVISPSQSDAMHALAKNSKLIKIEKAGHLSSLERPEEWNTAVMEYFGYD